MKVAAIVLGIVTLVGCASPPVSETGSATVDLILINGKIETVDPIVGEVEALAVANGRVLAVGSTDKIELLATGSTQIIDLNGKRAVPGFIEGHGHFTGIGDALQILNLNNVDNWDEVIEMVKDAVAKTEPGEWILGRGWHQEKWDRVPEDNVRGFPIHTALSAISVDNPVCLKHASGHACFFNAKAMELASITSKTSDPAGGEILHGEGGSPSGLFNETAMGLVHRVHAKEVAKRTDEQRIEDLRRSIRLADRDCLSKGITSFQDAGSSFATARVLRSMAEAGELGTRLWVMIRASNEDLANNLEEARVIGAGDDHLTVRAVKRSIDGALGSRGAWLLEPYSDAPESSGLNTATVASVEETARLAVEYDYQLCVHAIGDRANREVLDLYERTFAKAGARNYRWRIEHAQHVNVVDIPRFADLGVIASMQAVHCTSDGTWVPARLGNARSEEGAYVWKKFMDAGVLVTNGTDAPVEDVDPIASFHSSVTRLLRDGSVFYGDQRMTRMEALASYTINCAKAAFEEDIKGTLVPGKLADIVVLSNDILTVPENEIRDAKVLWTIVGGKVLYSNK
jgi:hypothetical protein